MRTHQKSVLFLVPYPEGIGPSQRFRIEIYLDELASAGVDYDYAPFLNMEDNRTLYDEGRWWAKSRLLFKAVLRRVALLFQLRRYDTVVVHREAMLLGPPILEWCIARLFKKKMVYDIDDAIWIPNISEMNKGLSFLKCHWKVNYIMRWSSTVMAGNDFLVAHAQQHCDHVVKMPTVVDTGRVHKAPVSTSGEVRGEVFTIGWTGTHSTNKHLVSLVPVLRRLREEYTFRLLAISNRRPDIDLEGFEYRPWNKETEISDLCEMDIGLMPLISSDEFAEGKCGFKAIQYMALGIPVILSPKGFNAELVQDGINGFHADSEQDWYVSINSLLQREVDLRQVVANARDTIVEHYSKRSQVRRFIESIC